MNGEPTSESTHNAKCYLLTKVNVENFKDATLSSKLPQLCRYV